MIPARSADLDDPLFAGSQNSTIPMDYLGVMRMPIYPFASTHPKMRILSLVILIMLVFSPNIFAHEFPWVLKKDTEGIQVHVRKVEGSPILEYNGSVVVPVGLERVVSLYENEKHTPEWFYQCIESKLLEGKGPDEKILYFAIDLPWPAEDRDSVYRRLRFKNPVTGTVEYKISALPGRYPPQDGRLRTPMLKGLWRFTPLADGRTEVYDQHDAAVGGYLPAFLVNRLAVNIPFNSLKNFRKKLVEETA